VVLSTSLFDPLEFAAPVVLQRRLLLRALTTGSCDWNAPLPDEKYKEWKVWRDSLKEVEYVKIPRIYAIKAKRCVSSVMLPQVLLQLLLTSGLPI